MYSRKLTTNSCLLLRKPVNLRLQPAARDVIMARVVAEAETLGCP